MLDYDVVKFSSDRVELNVNVSPNDDTVWLSLQQLCDLYDKNKSTISRHINNIFNSGELERTGTVAKNATVQFEGNREVKREIEYFNLDVIISIGYRVNSKVGIIFRKWASTVLREYLLKGYSIDKNRTLISNENYINLINKVDSIDKRISIIEDENKINKEYIFYDGQTFDAKSFLSKLISKATSSIILIDGYADIKALDLLKYKQKDVKIKIYKSKKSILSNRELNAFNKQYGDCTMVDIDNFHDRFIIIDKKELYHLGSSLNYIGKKTFAITKMETEEILTSLLKRIDYE